MQTLEKRQNSGYPVLNGRAAFRKNSHIKIIPTSRGSWSVYAFVDGSTGQRFTGYDFDNIGLGIKEAKDYLKGALS